MVCLILAKTVYFLSYACGKRKKEIKRRKRRKMKKIELFKFGFLDLVNG